MIWPSATLGSAAGRPWLTRSVARAAPAVSSTQRRLAEAPLDWCRRPVPIQILLRPATMGTLRPAGSWSNTPKSMELVARGPALRSPFAKASVSQVIVVWAAAHRTASVP